MAESDSSDQFHFDSADRETVRRLLLYDNVVWFEVTQTILLPLARCRKYVETLRRFQLEPEDLVSEVYKIVHRDHFARLKKFRFECSLKSWFYNILREAYSRILFRYEKKKRKITTVSSEIAVNRAQSTIKDGYREIAAVETKRKLNRALVRLWDRNPAEALTFLLREHLELTSKEAAQLLGKTVNHIDVLNMRAKKHLTETGAKSCVPAATAKMPKN